MSINKFKDPQIIVCKIWYILTKSLNKVKTNYFFFFLALKEAATIEVPRKDVTVSKFDLTTKNETDCKCDVRKDEKPQVEEERFENIIDFENNLQNFIYVK